jgi:hypothetical protein
LAIAEPWLVECCGWKVSDERIRRACQAESKRITDFRANSPEVTEVFPEAAGDLEFQTDAAKVNTTGGWRDMKMGIVARRQRGQPATPAPWDQRSLPAPTTPVALAAIEAIDELAPRWKEGADRRKIADRTTITVLGDGAQWIWNAATPQFGDGHQLLDIDPAAEPIDTAAKRVCGQGAAAVQGLNGCRQLLLSDGWAGRCDHLGQARATDNSPPSRSAADDLTSSFAAPTARLNSCHRLDTGQTIGSGMVQGAAKNLIGKRLKQTGARWEVDNVKNGIVADWTQKGLAGLTVRTVSKGRPPHDRLVHYHDRQQHRGPPP